MAAHRPPPATPDVDDLKITPDESPSAISPSLRVRVVTSSDAMIEAPVRLTTRTQRGVLTYGRLQVGDQILLEHDGEHVWEAIVSITAV
jgi:hypothetical protein